MKTPTEILAKFEQATEGLAYGSVTISLIIKEGRHRYVITREESVISNDFRDKNEEAKQALISTTALSRVLNSQKNCEKEP